MVRLVTEVMQIVSVFNKITIQLFHNIQLNSREEGRHSRKICGSPWFQNLLTTKWVQAQFENGEDISGDGQPLIGMISIVDC